MPKLRITNASIKKIKIPLSGRVTYTDTKVRGFRLRITHKGTITFSVRAELDGKTVRASLGRFPNLSADQAEKLAIKNLSEFAHNKNPTAIKKANSVKGITLSECFDQYKSSRTNLKETTKTEYSNTVNQYLSDWLNKPLIKITRDMIESRHKKIGEKSPTRANKTMRILRALFEFAHGKYEDQNGEPLILHNPVKRLSHVKAWYRETRRTGHISNSDLHKWFEAVNTAPEWMASYNPESSRDYLLLVLFTGLRRNEAAGILWENINFEQKTLTVIETKNGDDHVLPLTDYLYKLFKRRKKVTKDSIFVFPSNSKKGCMIDPKKFISSVRDKSDVYFTLHDLRRTFITIAESLNIRDYTLKRLLNHRNKADVTDGYIINNVERLREPMQLVTNELLILSICQDELKRVSKI